MLTAHECKLQQCMLKAELVLSVTSLILSPFSFFPNSLRYLVQQHVDLLHALQERVLSWPRQGILGDIFLKLTNDEVCYTISGLFCCDAWQGADGPSVSQDRRAAEWQYCEVAATAMPFCHSLLSAAPVHGSPLWLQLLLVRISTCQTHLELHRATMITHWQRWTIIHNINAWIPDLAGEAACEPWQLRCLYSQWRCEKSLNFSYIPLLQYILLSFDKQVGRSHSILVCSSQ